LIIRKKHTFNHYKIPYYVVFIYCDYRKDIGIQHLKVFTDREETIVFVKKYTSRAKRAPEYVGPCGNVYDEPFIVEVNEDEKEQQEYAKS